VSTHTNDNDDDATNDAIRIWLLTMKLFVLFGTNPQRPTLQNISATRHADGRDVARGHATAALQHGVSAVARTSHYGLCHTQLTRWPARSGSIGKIAPVRSRSKNCLQNGAAASILYAGVTNYTTNEAHHRHCHHISMIMIVILSRGLTWRLDKLLRIIL